MKTLDTKFASELKTSFTPVAWYACVTLLLVFIILQLKRSKKLSKAGSYKSKKVIPSPPKLPVIGHLHLMNGNPAIQFTKLCQTYGEIYYLKMGVFDTVVVNSLPLIREVLTDKYAKLTNRPNFLRYNVLFGNDKENSLAFCDWSQRQKTRRALARKFCHTGYYSERIESGLDKVGDIFMRRIEKNLKIHKDGACEFLKFDIQKACAAIFLDYFCSELIGDWDHDTEFNLVVKLFDEIFYEINQGHITDVLPKLKFLHTSHLNKLAQFGVEIRNFVMKRVIHPHISRLDQSNPKDFTDILLTHLEEALPENRLTMNEIVYELEDFIGGHAAVSNLLCRALLEIGSSPGMSKKIYQKYFVEHQQNYLHAVVYETLRKTSSPIVPHVASSNTSIDGYQVKEGTIVFINNYDLNTSNLYWDNPSKFNPDRFILPNDAFQKPAHFFPFSYGKRTCMGYQIVERVCEGLLNRLIRNYDIEAMENPTVLPVASVALHPLHDVRVKFIPRLSN